MKPEFRKSERFVHENIIKVDDDRALSTYYAISNDLSETGMNFKSLFDLFSGAYILIIIDDPTLSRYQVPAKVVWCNKLKDSDRFRDSVGVEFFRLQKNFGLKASLPTARRMKTHNMTRDEAVIEMGKS